MIFEIKHRITDSVIFGLECGSMKLCVEAAINDGANLTGANLRHADLRHVGLRGANLTRANLRHADLRGADLTGANLRHADLRGADLTGANLTGANLTGANLTEADLRGAKLTGANLTQIRDDLWAVLACAPREVVALRQALIDGRVDGSAYVGECACLIGTIANIRGENYRELDGLEQNPSRPIEKFFTSIRKGDTPDTNQVSALVVQWTNEFLSNTREEYGSAS